MWHFNAWTKHLNLGKSISFSLAGLRTLTPLTSRDQIAVAFRENGTQRLKTSLSFAFNNTLKSHYFTSGTHLKGHRVRAFISASIKWE